LDFIFFGIVGFGGHCVCWLFGEKEEQEMKYVFWVLITIALGLVVAAFLFPKGSLAGTLCIIFGIVFSYIIFLLQVGETLIGTLNGDD
jgi:hypothetical protein